MEVLVPTAASVSCEVNMILNQEPKKSSSNHLESLPSLHSFYLQMPHSSQWYCFFERSSSKKLH